MYFITSCIYIKMYDCNAFCHCSEIVKRLEPVSNGVKRYISASYYYYYYYYFKLQYWL